MLSVLLNNNNNNNNSNNNNIDDDDDHNSINSSNINVAWISCNLVSGLKYIVWVLFRSSQPCSLGMAETQHDVRRSDVCRL